MNPKTPPPSLKQFFQTHSHLSEQEYEKTLAEYAQIMKTFKESEIELPELTIYQNPKNYRLASLVNQYERIQPVYDTQALWILRCKYALAILGPALYTGAFLKYRKVESSISRGLIVLCGAFVPSAIAFHAIRLAELRKKW